MSEFALLKVSNDNIIFGKGGYLFPIFLSFDTNLLKTNLFYLDEFSARSSYPVSIIVVPSAYVPLYDLLPYDTPAVDQRYFIAKLGIYLSVNANFININDLFTINSTKDDLYYKTDKHWTTYGAWLAYSQFCSQKGFAPYDFKETKPLSSNNFLGDIYEHCPTFIKQYDYVEYFDFSDTRSLVDGRWEDGTFCETMFQSDTPYDAFLFGGNVSTIETNSETAKNDSILVITDSFGYSFIPFLTSHYQTIDIINIEQLKNTKPPTTEKVYDDILILCEFEKLVNENIFDKDYVL